MIFIRKKKLIVGGIIVKTDFLKKLDTRAVIVLEKSLIGCKPKQRKTARALGLRKRGDKKEHLLNKPILGMVKAIEHLLAIK